MNEQFTDKDYNQLGVNAANLFVSKKEKTLMDAVLKVANDNNLSTTGVERLSEKANQFTQLSILKYASDKKMEFDLVDPKIAARNYSVNNTKKQIEKEASSFTEQTYSQEIPNYVLNSKLDKLASYEASTKSLTKIASNENTLDFKQLKKARNDIKLKIDSIKLDKMASYLQMEKIVDDVIYEYSQYDNKDNFNKLASDAYNKYGNEVLPFLKHVGIAVRQPLNKEFIKEASSSNGIIDDTTSIMCKVASYIDNQRLFFKSDINIKDYQNKLDIVNSALNIISKRG